MTAGIGIMGVMPISALRALDGHPQRLNRETLNESYRFGDLNYAKEEFGQEWLIPPEL